MEITMTNNSTKAYLARFGDADIFGSDSDVRKKMDIDEATSRFDSVWQTNLGREVHGAQIVTYEEACKLLKQNVLHFLLTTCEQRQFVLQGVPFIAQVKKHADGSYECNQLWSLGKHQDNTRLSVYFETVELRERFERISKKLGWESTGLAEHLLYSFMEAVDPKNIA
jgi:hypothetical protein